MPRPKVKKTIPKRKKCAVRGCVLWEKHTTKCQVERPAAKEREGKSS